MGLKPGLYGAKPAPNHLSYGTATNDHNKIHVSYLYIFHMKKLFWETDKNLRLKLEYFHSFFLAFSCSAYTENDLIKHVIIII
jgi:hypothetical protein